MLHFARVGLAEMLPPIGPAGRRRYPFRVSLRRFLEAT